MSGAPANKSNPLVFVLVVALVVVGAGAVGWFLFNKDEPAVAEPVATVHDAAPAAGSAAKPPVVAPKRDPGTTVSESAEPNPERGPTREYYVDGKLIRDHRPESYAPIDLPPAIHPPDGRKIQPESTSAITQAYKAVMRGCVASIPAAERTGAKPKMESTIAIAVKNKTATIIKAAVQLRDVSGAASDAAKACIEQKALAVTAPVDEADLDSYDITTSFVF